MDTGQGFAGPRLGNAFRAATPVHVSARATGHAVDIVTAAWVHQRSQHGDGLPVPSKTTRPDVL